MTLKIVRLPRAKLAREPSYGICRIVEVACLRRRDSDRGDRGRFARTCRLAGAYRAALADRAFPRLFGGDVDLLPFSATARHRGGRDHDIGGAYGGPSG